MPTTSALNFDYIVVGAGSAGCVVGRRLSERRGVSTLILEAGGSDRHPFISMPAAFTLAIGNRKLDWGYTTGPEAGLANREIAMPRGKVLGGSSSINAMAFVRGQAADFDGWASDHGLTDWAYAKCLPFFRKLETFDGPPTGFRGHQGLLHVHRPSVSGTLDRTFLEACRQAGYDRLADINADAGEGFGAMDQTIRDGRRESAASAYLRPVLRSQSLDVRLAATVTRIEFEDGRAVAVRFAYGGIEHLARARREIILCAGAIGTPQLLLVSGIGPAEQLRRLGVAVIADRREVGRNLQDHVDVSVSCNTASKLTMSAALRWFNKPWIMGRWLASRTGAGATNHFEVVGSVRSHEKAERPDIQIAFIPLLFRPTRVFARTAHGLQATIMVLRPQSRGTVELALTDRGHAPQLSFGYLQKEEDIAALRAGIRIFQNILARPAMKPFGLTPLSPSSTAQSDAELDDYIRSTAKSTHHPCGTCRMGIDQAAVVNEVGLVNGVAGLRVIDASIFPEITSGNINAPVMMAAEKLVEKIAL